MSLKPPVLRAVAMSALSLAAAIVLRFLMDYRLTNSLLIVLSLLAGIAALVQVAQALSH